jgi:NAD-dependent deacetylase
MDEHAIIELAEALSRAGRVSVLTGAGISAESGVPTFRGREGLWKHHRAESLATPEAFERDPALVWEWYDWRRGLIGAVSPNPAHHVLASWESLFSDLTVITQNVDGLHGRAGSRSLLELHGNIWKLRCTREQTVREDLSTPLPAIPPLCPGCGALLRPHVVWFGEPLDPGVINEAFQTSAGAEVMLVVGTSAVVHPAASLPAAAASAGALVAEINPDPTPLTPSLEISIRGRAGEILPLVDRRLRDLRPAPGAWPEGKKDS